MAFIAMMNELSDAEEKLSGASQTFSSDVSVAQRRNQMALSSGKGEWKDSALDRFMLLQTGLQALQNALDDLGKTCAACLDDLQVLAGQRDAVLNAAGTSCSSGNRIYCEGSAHILSDVMAVKGTLGSLSKGVEDASSGLRNLEQGNECDRIRQALAGLSTGIRAQTDFVQKIGNAWNVYQPNVQSFDDKYHGKFSQPLVTQHMMDIAGGDTLSTVMDYYNGIKTVNEKAMESFSRILTLVSTFTDLSKVLEGNPKLAGKIVQYVGEADRSNALTKDEFEAIKKAIFASSHGEDEASFAKRFLKKLRPGSDYEKWTDISNEVKDPDIGVSGKGKLNGIAKGAGELGTILQFTSIGVDGYNAYQFTKGNSGDKWAAVVTEVGADALDVGITYGVTAAASSVAPWPVGAVIGVAAGAAIDLVWEKQKQKSWYKNGKEWFRNQADKALGGTHHD